MRFSVIVPIYNVEPYLRQCVDSILAQTYGDFELILVDDGSPDGCPAICDQYAEKDSRVKVIHKENGGLVSARQAGIAAAQGEYVVNVDSDDWVAPHMLEEAWALLLSQQVDMVCFGVTYVYPKRREIVTEPVPEGRYDRTALEQKILPKLLLDDNAGHMLYYLWGKVFRRERLYACQMAVDQRIALGEDVTCLVPYYMNSESVYISSTPMYFCRWRSQSMSRLFNIEHYNQIALGVEALEQIDGSAVKNFQAQIDRYGCFSCFVLLASAARAGAFQQIGQIRNAMEQPVLRRAIQSAHFQHLSLKTRVALFLLRRNWIGGAYGLLWVCARLKGILKK